MRFLREQIRRISAGTNGHLARWKGNQMNHKTLRLFALMAVFALVIAACGGGQAATTTTTASRWSLRPPQEMMTTTTAEEMMTDLTSMNVGRRLWRGPR